MKKKSAGSVLLLALVLTGVWYLLSGKFDLLHFGTGVITALVIAWSLARVGDAQRVRVGVFLAFVPWLMWQIVLSNLRVARLVLSPGMPISPAFLAQEPGVTGARALTTLGASITLTPGTLTVELNEREIFVHALDPASAQDIRDQTMMQRVERLFPQEEAS